MFSLNKSSLFLTPLRVYLSANPLFCRFRVFSLFDLREGVWLADVYECPPVSQTEIVKLLRLSKMERNSASKRSIRRFVVTEKAPTRTFSWLKAATTGFTFKTLLRHYAKRALTPRSLNVKLGPRRKYHEGLAAIRHYANQTACPL